jgi:molecular chaperone Hsp33
MPDFLNTDRPPVPQLVVPTAMQPFHLEGRPVRGRLVRLGALADALLSRHNYSPPVGRVVGEAMALTAALALGMILLCKGRRDSAGPATESVEQSRHVLCY